MEGTEEGITPIVDLDLRRQGEYYIVGNFARIKRSIEPSEW